MMTTRSNSAAKVSNKMTNSAVVVYWLHVLFCYYWFTEPPYDPDTTKWCEHNAGKTDPFFRWKGPMTYQDGLDACKANGLKLAVVRKQEHIDITKTVIKGDATNGKHYMCEC